MKNKNGMSGNLLLGCTVLRITPGFPGPSRHTYGRMSEAARKVIKNIGDMYEQMHGGDDSDGYVPRSVFVDHCRQVIYSFLIGRLTGNPGPAGCTS